jgi:hypothetical protein
MSIGEAVHLRTFPVQFSLKVFTARIMMSGVLVAGLSTVE